MKWMLTQHPLIHCNQFPSFLRPRLAHLTLLTLLNPMIYTHLESNMHSSTSNG